MIDGEGLMLWMIALHFACEAAFAVSFFSRDGDISGIVTALERVGCWEMRMELLGKCSRRKELCS